MRHPIWKWLVLPVLFFSAMTTVLTFPFPLHMKDTVLHQADPLLNAWILAWDAHILLRDPIALYQANDFYPYSNTLAYSEILLAQGLLAIPIIWLTNNPILGVNIAWFSSFVLSGVAMYVLIYHFTRHLGASLVAGTIYAFNPFRFAHIFHVQVLSSQWAPVAFLFLDRLIKRQKFSDAAGWTLFLNLQFLSSYYHALFSTVAVGVLMGGYWLWERQRFSCRLFFLLLICLVISAAIQIPLVTPYFFVSRSMGFERSLEDAIRGGASLTDFITAPSSNWLYGPLTSHLRGEGWWEHITFPGVVAVALAVVGLFNGLKQRCGFRKWVVQYLILTVVLFVFSLGPSLRIEEHTIFSPLPYRLLYDYLPGFRAIRQPARFHVFTMAGLSLLAGVGVVAIDGCLKSIRHKTIMVITLICLIALENLAVPLPYVHMPLNDRIPTVYCWLAEQPGDGPVLELPILMDVGAVEAPRLYYSAFHWKKLVNGYGGFLPPVYAHFLFFDREFPDQSYRWIVGLGVRYVILHRWQYDAQELRRIDERLSGFQDRLRLVADFGDDQVFEVIQPATGMPNAPMSDQTLDGKVALLGYYFEPLIVHPGTTVQVDLFWQSKAPMTTDYTVFVHIIDSESGRLVAQHDGQPVNGERPTSTWKYDEVVLDTHQITIPHDLPIGVYEVRTGMYELRTMKRLPVQGKDGMIQGDFLLLGWLRVSE